MQIKGLQGLSVDDINRELAHGAKFVLFQYTISIIVMTFKQPSDIYFIKSNQNSVVKGLPFTFISIFLGWWGIPWGPIYTIGSLYQNLTGGKDVTAEVLQSMNQQS